MLVVNEHSGEAGFFQPYLEQRLRRAIQHEVVERWGWMLQGQQEPLLVHIGVILGIDGKVIEDRTKLLLLAIPPEFEALCSGYEHDVENVLRDFMVDACGLKNDINAPGNDDFIRNGNAERAQGYAYLERVYGIWREQ